MSENDGKTSWIYKLNKDELMAETERQGISSAGNVEELRKRLVEHTRQGTSTSTNLNSAAKNSNTEKPTNETTNKHTNNSSTYPPSVNLTNLEQIIGEAVRRAVTDLTSNPNILLPSNTLQNSANVQPIEELNEEHRNNRHEPTDIEIAELVRKWNVHFDGSNDAGEFIERMEELAECYEVPVNRLTRTLPDKFRGKALEWFRNNREQWNTWEEFEQNFRGFFLPQRHRMKLEDEIRRRTQHPREKGRDFVNNLQTMYRHLGRVSADDQLERIYTNLRLEYRMYIRRQDFRTLPELIVFIEQYEELLREHPRTTNHGMNDEQRKNPPPTMTPSTKSLMNQTSTPPENPSTAHNPFRTPFTNPPNNQKFNRDTDCWRCGQTGHTRFECPNASIPLCSRCGKIGNPRNCECMPGNEQRGPSNERA